MNRRRKGTFGALSGTFGGVKAPLPVVLLCYGQGLFYFATGIWPLVARRSFQWVTGPKTDFWLAQTVGSLLALTGLVLLVAARRRSVSTELAVFASGQALILALIDLIMAGRGKISNIYLADAVVELALAVAWLVFYFAGKQEPVRSLER